ncbi:hypothetical protein [Nocardia sp. MH4]|uniref:hypothetical protein n=1 Tax=Nocardia sp. MH4 TaxID=1768677 RepID=UPI001C4F4CAB|nr:hypothetical protein [Nocardia sp. MH4]
MYRVADQRPASGGTAVVAAALALLGGIAGAVGVLFGLFRMVRSETGVFGWGIAPGWVSVVSGATLLVDVLSAVSLSVGAILLFRRRGAGPTLVALGSVGTLGAYVVTAMSTAVQLLQYDLPIGRHLDAVLGQSVFNGLFSVERSVPWMVSVLLLVFPVVTFVLAVLPSTRRWCKAARPPGGRGTRELGRHPGIPSMAGVPGRPWPGAPHQALHAQPPGAQFTGGAPYPGMPPVPDALDAGRQQAPGAPHAGAQPALGALHSGAQPTPYPSAPLRPDAQRPDSPAPNQGAPQGYQRPTGPPQDHRPQDGYRA